MANLSSLSHVCSQCSATAFFTNGRCQAPKRNVDIFRDQRKAVPVSYVGAPGTGGARFVEAKSWGCVARTFALSNMALARLHRLRVRTAFRREAGQPTGSCGHRSVAPATSDPSVGEGAAVVAHWPPFGKTHRFVSLHGSTLTGDVTY